jgi:hypothetical protein
LPHEVTKFFDARIMRSLHHPHCRVEAEQRQEFNGCGSGRMIRLAARAVLAACIIGAPIALDMPSVIDQQMKVDKPGTPRPGEPRGDGCVPIGVTKSPNGIVYADEDCHGKIYRSRMN